MNRTNFLKSGVRPPPLAHEMQVLGQALVFVQDVHRPPTGQVLQQQRRDVGPGVGIKRGAHVSDLRHIAGMRRAMLLAVARVNPMRQHQAFLGLEVRRRIGGQLVQQSVGLGHRRRAGRCQQGRGLIDDRDQGLVLLVNHVDPGFEELTPLNRHEPLHCLHRHSLPPRRGPA